MKYYVNHRHIGAGIVHIDQLIDDKDFGVQPIIKNNKLGLVSSVFALAFAVGVMMPSSQSVYADDLTASNTIDLSGITVADDSSVSDGDNSPLGAFADGDPIDLKGFNLTITKGHSSNNIGAITDSGSPADGIVNITLTTADVATITSVDLGAAGKLVATGMNGSVSTPASNTKAVISGAADLRSTALSTITAGAGSGGGGGYGGGALEVEIGGALTVGGQTNNQALTITGGAANNGDDGGNALLDVNGNIIFANSANIINIVGGGGGADAGDATIEAAGNIGASGATGIVRLDDNDGDTKLTLNGGTQAVYANIEAANDGEGALNVASTSTTTFHSSIASSAAKLKKIDIDGTAIFKENIFTNELDVATNKSATLEKSANIANLSGTGSVKLTGANSVLETADTAIANSIMLNNTNATLKLTGDNAVISNQIGVEIASGHGLIDIDANVTFTSDVGSLVVGGTIGKLQIADGKTVTFGATTNTASRNSEFNELIADGTDGTGKVKIVGGNSSSNNTRLTIKGANVDAAIELDDNASNGEARLEFNNTTSATNVNKAIAAASDGEGLITVKSTGGVTTFNADVGSSSHKVKKIDIDQNAIFRGGLFTNQVDIATGKNITISGNANIAGIIGNGAINITATASSPATLSTAGTAISNAVVFTDSGNNRATLKLTGNATLDGAITASSHGHGIIDVDGNVVFKTPLGTSANAIGELDIANGKTATFQQSSTVFGTLSANIGKLSGTGTIIVKANADPSAGGGAGPSPGPGPGPSGPPSAAPDPGVRNIFQTSDNVIDNNITLDSGNTNIVAFSFNGDAVMNGAIDANAANRGVVNANANVTFTKAVGGTNGILAFNIADGKTATFGQASQTTAINNNISQIDAEGPDRPNRSGKIKIVGGANANATTTINTNAGVKFDINSDIELDKNVGDAILNITNAGGALTVSGAITATDDGDGEIRVNRVAGLSFTNTVGAMGKSVGQLSVADNTTVTFGSTVSQTNTLNHYIGNLSTSGSSGKIKIVGGTAANAHTTVTVTGATVSTAIELDKNQGDAIIDFAGSSAMTIHKAVTATDNGNGQIKVSNSAGATFVTAIGTSVSKIGVFDVSGNAIIKEQLHANNITIATGGILTFEKSQNIANFSGNGAIGIKAQGAANTFQTSKTTVTNGFNLDDIGANKATLKINTANSTYSGNITAQDNGDGLIDIDANTTISGMIGTASNKVGEINVAAAATTFSGSIYADKFIIDASSASRNATLSGADIDTAFTFTEASSNTATLTISGGSASAYRNVKQEIKGASTLGAAKGTLTIANGAFVDLSNGVQNMKNFNIGVAGANSGGNVKLKVTANAYSADTINLIAGTVITLSDINKDETLFRANNINLAKSITFKVTTADLANEDEITLFSSANIKGESNEAITTANIGDYLKLEGNDSFSFTTKITDNAIKIIAEESVIKELPSAFLTETPSVSKADETIFLQFTNLLANTKKADGESQANKTAATESEKIIRKMITDATASNASVADKAKLETFVKQVSTQSETIASASSSVSQFNNSSVANTSQRLASLRNVGGAIASGFNAGQELLKKSLWGKLFVNDAVQETQGNIAGYDVTNQGLVIGGDVELHAGSNLGVSVSYNNGDVKGKGAGNSTQDIKNVSVSLYGNHGVDGNHFLKGGFVEGQINYGQSKVKTSRKITALDSILSGDYDVNNYSARIAYGKDFNDGNNGNITPTLAMQYSIAQSDTYTETSNNANGNFAVQRYEIDDVKQLLLSAGASWNGQKIQLPDNGNIGIYVGGYINYDANGKQPKAIVSFANDASTRNVTNGHKSSKVSVDTNFGFNYQKDNATIGLDYSGHFKNNYHSHSASLNTKIRF